MTPIRVNVIVLAILAYLLASENADIRLLVAGGFITLAGSLLNSDSSKTDKKDKKDD